MPSAYKQDTIPGLHGMQAYIRHTTISCNNNIYSHTGNAQTPYISHMHTWGTHAQHKLYISQVHAWHSHTTATCAHWRRGVYADIWLQVELTLNEWRRDITLSLTSGSHHAPMNRTEEQKREG